MATDISNTRLVIRFVGFLLVMLGVLLATAGTMRWLEAYLYVGVYVAFSLPTVFWLKRHNPALLKDRMTFMKSTVRPWDKAIIWGSAPIYLVFLVLPGLDAVRFGWTAVPVGARAVAFATLGASMVLFFLVMRENSFLSRIVEIQKDRGHTVISTGPYAVVRHPMYVAVIVNYLATPFALGSLWTLVPAAGMAAVLLVRTVLEDRTLHAELEGYRDYAGRVRYRLCPGIW